MVTWTEVVVSSAAVVGVLALVLLAWLWWCEHQFTRFRDTGWRLDLIDVAGGHGSLLTAELGDYNANGRSVIGTVWRANRTLNLAVRLGSRSPRARWPRLTRRTESIWKVKALGRAA